MFSGLSEDPSDYSILPILKQGKVSLAHNFSYSTLYSIYFVSVKYMRGLYGVLQVEKFEPHGMMMLWKILYGWTFLPKEMQAPFTHCLENPFVNLCVFLFMISLVYVVYMVCEGIKYVLKVKLSTAWRCKKMHLKEMLFSCPVKLHFRKIYIKKVDQKMKGFDGRKDLLIM